MYGNLSKFLLLASRCLRLAVAINDMLSIFAAWSGVSHCDFDLFLCSGSLFGRARLLCLASALLLLILEPVIDESRELLPFTLVLDLVSKIYDNIAE